MKGSRQQGDVRTGRVLAWGYAQVKAFGLCAAACRIRCVALNGFHSALASLRAEWGRIPVKGTAWRTCAQQKRLASHLAHARKWSGKHTKTRERGRLC